MNQKQINLLTVRLITQTMKYNGMEPPDIKKKNDKTFCNEFFNQNTVDLKVVEEILTESINNHNDYELDLLLMLLEHFQITSHFILNIAPLLIQSWHHWHDRIARLLMSEKSIEAIPFLYQGATYCCENLDYQSDYNEFNRKCIYALRNIATTEALACLQKLCKHKNENISTIAKEVYCYMGGARN